MYKLIIPCRVGRYTTFLSIFFHCELRFKRYKDACTKDKVLKRKNALSRAQTKNMNTDLLLLDCNSYYIAEYFCMTFSISIYFYLHFLLAGSILYNNDNDTIFECLSLTNCIMYLLILACVSWSTISNIFVP